MYKLVIRGKTFAETTNYLNKNFLLQTKVLDKDHISNKFGTKNLTILELIRLTTYRKGFNEIDQIIYN